MQADLLGLLPEGILTVAILAVLLVGARRGLWPGRKSWLTWLSTVGLIGAGVALAFADPQDRSLFSGMVALDGMGLFFRGLFLVAGLWLGNFHSPLPEPMCVWTLNGGVTSSKIFCPRDEN